MCVEEDERKTRHYWPEGNKVKLYTIWQDNYIRHNMIRTILMEQIGGKYLKVFFVKLKFNATLRVNIAQ